MAFCALILFIDTLCPPQGISFLFQPPSASCISPWLAIYILMPTLPLQPDIKPISSSFHLPHSIKRIIPIPNLVTEPTPQQRQTRALPCLPPWPLVAITTTTTTFSTTHPPKPPRHQNRNAQKHRRKRNQHNRQRQPRPIDPDARLSRHHRAPSRLAPHTITILPHRRRHRSRQPSKVPFRASQIGYTARVQRL